jgi:mannopine transport system substrate-binding protein
MMGASAAGMAANATSGSGALAAPNEELTIVATGGSFGKALREFFYDPFTKETGIKIKDVSATGGQTWAQLKAMQQTGRKEWDIITAYPEDLVGNADLLEPFECKKLPNYADQAVDGACEPNGLLRTAGGVAITYDLNKYKDGPKSWADFWDVKTFPGPRSLPNTGAPWWVLMAALMADGVLHDKLFPLDLDRAFKKLDELRPNVTVWWKTGDQSQQMFRSGEVSMGMIWTGRAFAMIDEKMPLRVVWNGAVSNFADWAIVKDTPNKEAALKFLNFYLSRPEAHLPFSEQVNYDTSNRTALTKLSVDERERRMTSPENWSKIAIVNAEWVAKNHTAVLERWNRWLAS